MKVKPADADRFIARIRNEGGEVKEQKVNQEFLVLAQADGLVSHSVAGAIAFKNQSLGKEQAELIKIWCGARRYPIPETEYPFAESIGRRWKFDLAWPEQKIAVEFEGGIYRREDGGQNHHVSIDGYESDCEKYTTAAIQFGFRIIRVTYAMHRRGETLAWLEKVLPLG